MALSWDIDLEITRSITAWFNLFCGAVVIKSETIYPLGNVSHWIISGASGQDVVLLNNAINNPVQGL